MIGIVVGCLALLGLIGGGIAMYRSRSRAASLRTSGAHSVRNEGSVSSRARSRSRDTRSRSRETRTSNTPANERSGIFSAPSTSYTTGQESENIEMDMYSEPTRNEELTVEITSS